MEEGRAGGKEGVGWYMTVRQMAAAWVGRDVREAGTK